MSLGSREAFIALGLFKSSDDAGIAEANLEDILQVRAISRSYDKVERTQNLTSENAVLTATWPPGSYGAISELYLIICKWR